MSSRAAARSNPVPDVKTIREFKVHLSEIVRDLQARGAEAPPVFVGAQRKSQAVMLSLAEYVRLLDVADEMAIAKEVDARIRARGQNLTEDELLEKIGVRREEFDAL